MSNAYSASFEGQPLLLNQEGPGVPQFPDLNFCKETTSTLRLYQPILFDPYRNFRIDAQCPTCYAKGAFRWENQDEGAKSRDCIPPSPYVIPIIGCRKVEHLQENLKALDVTLTQEQTQKIEDATTFEIGFPFKTFGTGVTPFGVTTKYLCRKP
ncbi:hypothetical protein H4582DRAFT_2081828 [Lactarius indigo]|nr:hypothetical protein H4582DRAFT_2081828 [Lactarius indigo]